MKLKYYLYFLFFCSLNCYAQFPNILISNVSSPNEPSIFINPKNTNQIVAGANLNSIYQSNDAGYTWVRKPMVSSFGVWGDPCIVADTLGKFYYFHLSNTSGTNGWIDRMVCQRLDSFNGNWTAGVGFSASAGTSRSTVFALTTLIGAPASPPATSNSSTSMGSFCGPMKAT